LEGLRSDNPAEGAGTGEDDSGEAPSQSLTLADIADQIHILVGELNKRLSILHASEEVSLDLWLDREVPTIGFKRPEDTAPRVHVDVFLKV
jgi:hypothetical protein